MDFIGFFYGFGLLQGLILAGILVVAGSGHRQANSIMAALVVLISLSLLQSWLIRLGYYQDNPVLALLIPALDLAWGPLLYLYAFSLTGGGLRGKQLLHLAPALGLLLATNLPFWNLGAEQQARLVEYIWSLRDNPALQQEVREFLPAPGLIWVDFHLHSTLFVVQFATYCFLVLRQIQFHNQRLQQHYSSMEFMNLRWLRILTAACLAFLVVFLVFNRTQLLLTGHFDVNAMAASTPSVFLVILIYIIAISAIFQSSLVSGVSAALTSDPRQDSPGASTLVEVAPAESDTDSAPAVEVPPDRPSSTKYERSALSKEVAQHHKMELMRIMQEEALYLDSELTLPDLAQKAGLTPHHVSQVLNGQMNQNFFSFVNNYRIQLAQELLSGRETRDMPIVELALEVGFKSKSSFYDAFRKATHMTPTQYKRSAECQHPPGQRGDTPTSRKNPS